MAVDEIRTAEAEIARGEAIGADELRRLMAEPVRTVHVVRIDHRADVYRAR